MRAAAKKKTAEPEQPVSSFLDEASDRVTALVLARGYDNTPMSLIAKELGMTKAGVYHHFASKEDLLYAVHRRAIDRLLLPIIEQAEAEPEPEARVRLFIYEYARLMTRDASARVLITEARRLSPEHFAEIREVWRRGYKLVRDSLAALHASGRCRKDLDPTYSAFAGLGMCGWIFFWFDYTRQDSGADVARTVCDIFMTGILTKSPG